MVNGELRTELCPDIFDGALDLAAIEAEDSGSLLCGSDPSDCCVESGSRLLFAVLRTPHPKGALAMTMPNDNGIFWRSEVLSRLDRALDSCGAAREAGRRDPKGLRAAADYCRKVASGLDAAVAANLYAVAADLEAEALRNEVFMRSDCSSKTVLTD